MAASLTRLARSAPEKPGVPRATSSGRRRGRAACPGSARPGWRPARQVGQRDRHLRSNGPGAAGRVEDFGPVGGRQDHDARGGIEAVHLGKQLVEGLLPLVVGDHAPEPARRWPMASISSMKMMAGARLRASANRSRTRAAPDPDEHLHEAGAGDREEGHAASPATARASSVCRCRAGRP